MAVSERTSSHRLLRRISPGVVRVAIVAGFRHRHTSLPRSLTPEPASGPAAGPTADMSVPWQSTLDPHHALRRDVLRRGFQVHRRRRNLGRRQHGTDEPDRLRPGHQSLDPRHALCRDGQRRSPQVHGLRRTWAPASTGLPDQEIFALAIDPANPSTLYAGMGDASDGYGVLQIHRLRRHLGHGQLRIVRPGQRTGHQSPHPLHALCRDGSRRLQVHRRWRYVDQGQARD